MIGEIEAFLDKGVGFNQPMFARSFARMRQHILDNHVRALAVLNDLVKIVAQGVRRFRYFAERISIGLHFAESSFQFVDQFGRDSREIVDEIQWVFDFMSDPGSQLAEGGKLLRLDKAILSGPQILERFSQFACPSSHALE